MTRLYISPTGLSLSAHVKRTVGSATPDDIQSFLNSAPDAELKKASAELNSLFSMGLSEDDKVLLLASDTGDGEMVARLLGTFLEDRLLCEVSVKRIQGLQTGDRIQFDREGIPNLTEEVVRQIEDHRYSYQVIINATAGYKATVPYLTLIGMVFEVPIRYLFEFSSEIIELPPLPLQFNLDKLQTLSPVIDGILNDLLPVAEVCTALNISAYRLSEEFSDLLLIEDGMVMLRPTGRILYLRYLQTHGYRKVLIHRRVTQKLASGAYDRQLFMSLFNRMKDPVYLKSKLHSEVKQAGRIDLDCFKQGWTSERIFLFEKDRSLHIADIFIHDEYERFLSSGRLLVAEQELKEYSEL